MGKQEFNYAVLRSGFGDLWVGKIALEANEITIFANFDDAIAKALRLNDSIDNAEEIEDIDKEELEPLSKEMARWIINS